MSYKAYLCNIPQVLIESDDFLAKDRLRTSIVGRPV
jgi:hypothetical protein